MLTLFARSRSIARAVAGLSSLVALAAPSDAQASCIDVTGGLCNGVGADAFFLATVVAVDASANPQLVTFHVDKLVVRAGGKSSLVEGSDASRPLVDAPPVGTSLIGESFITVSGGERFESLSAVAADGMVHIGIDGEVRLSKAEALGLASSAGCEGLLEDRLEAAGVEVGCHDTGCSVGLAPGASGALPRAIAIALGAAALARGARRRRSR